MRENVLVPLCRLLPSVRSVEVRSDRVVDGWGKDQYWVGFPRIVDALKAGSRPLCGPPVERDPKLVTLTLREAEHYPLRNSKVGGWGAAANSLRERGLEVLIIPDAARAGHDVSDGAVLAARDLQYRAVLYSRAALNVGISNGPMWMSIFMDAPTLMLRPTTNADGGCYDDAFYARFGVRRGEQLPRSPLHQRLAWEEDTKDNIVRAVEEMLCHVK